MSEKKRFPLSQAEEVALDLVNYLRGWCEIIEIAGSIRRRKPKVGDIEIVYVPRFAMEKDGLFDTKRTCLADAVIQNLITRKIISPRGIAWGEKNKFAVHLASGIPVDFFATKRECWPNYLVCRTGGAINNTRIATAGKWLGLKWHPYGIGFVKLGNGEWLVVKSEADVYRFVNLPFLPPEKRL